MKTVFKAIYKGIAVVIVVALVTGIVSGFAWLLYDSAQRWARVWHVPTALAFFSPFIAAGIIAWAILTVCDPR